MVLGARRGSFEQTVRYCSVVRPAFFILLLAIVLMTILPS